MNRISIIGAGSFGMALAQMFACTGKEVMVWARRIEAVEAINKDHHTSYLPDISLEPTIKATNSLHEAAAFSDVVLLATPAQSMRAVLSGMQAIQMKDKTIVILSKGVEISSGKLLSVVAKEVLPKAHYAILTGPGFAAEIAKGLPICLTVAAETMERAMTLRDFLGTKNFRPYASDDIIGAQIGGAIKNVLAIASGAVMGLGLGESARAALITRGIAEMGRLTMALGGKKETLMGMSGMGDVLLSCTTLQSRNYSLGFALGEGQCFAKIMEERKTVTEGVHTAKALKMIIEEYALDMPVCETVYDLVYQDLDVKTAIERMLSRPFKQEG